MPAMRPRVNAKNGQIITPEMTVLFVPKEPADSTAFFRFQVLKSNEEEAVREAALGFLAAEFFQLPERFSDEMTAVFGTQSELSRRLLAAKSVVLQFAQFSQRFEIPCKVRRLGADDPTRELSFWQARIFNANLPRDATVLGFQPDWRDATADPAPGFRGVSGSAPE